MKKRTLPKGHKSILSKEFTYVPAAATDVRATFDRIRKRLAAKRKPLEQNVTPIKGRKP